MIISDALNQHVSNSNKLILGHPGKGMAFHPGEYDHCKNAEEIKVRFLDFRHRLSDDVEIDMINEHYHINLANNKFDEEANEIPGPQD